MKTFDVQVGHFIVVTVKDADSEEEAIARVSSKLAPILKSHPDWEIVARLKVSS